MNQPPVKFVQHLAFTTVALGHVGSRYGTNLTILSGSSLDENVYAPAESVVINGIEGIVALQVIIEEMIARFKELNPEPKKESITP